MIIDTEKNVTGAYIHVFIRLQGEQDEGSDNTPFAVSTMPLEQLPEK